MKITIVKVNYQEKIGFKAKLLQLKLIHVFARAILFMKKLEIEKNKPTLIIKWNTRWP